MTTRNPSSIAEVIRVAKAAGAKVRYSASGKDGRLTLALAPITKRPPTLARLMAAEHVAEALRDAGYTAIVDVAHPSGGGKSVAIRVGATKNPRSTSMARKNPLGTYIVTHARVNPTGDVDDLVLFTTNDGDLYRQQVKPIIENLAKKMAKDNYSASLAAKTWGYLAENGARKYAWEVARNRKPGTSYWHQQGADGNGLFPKSARDVAAREMEQHYREEVEERAAELRAKVKGKAKKNPPSSGIIPMVAPSGGAAWVQQIPATNPWGNRKKAKKNPAAKFQAGDYRPRTKIGTYYKKGTDILRVDDVGYHRRHGALRPDDWSVVFLGTLTDVPKTGPSPYAQAAHHEMKPYEIERNGYRKVKAESLNENWRAFFARHKP
jgi:hypothetical protein